MSGGCSKWTDAAAFRRGILCDQHAIDQDKERTLSYKHIKPLNVGLRHTDAALKKVSCRMQGIKITDAASKKKARDTLEAEAALRKMDVESNVDWEEAAGSDLEKMED